MNITSKMIARIISVVGVFSLILLIIGYFMDMIEMTPAVLILLFIVSVSLILSFKDSKGK